MAQTDVSQLVVQLIVQIPEPVSGNVYGDQDIILALTAGGAVAVHLAQDVVLAVVATVAQQPRIFISS